MSNRWMALSVDAPDQRIQLTSGEVDILTAYYEMPVRWLLVHWDRTSGLRVVAYVTRDDGQPLALIGKFYVDDDTEQWFRRTLLELLADRADALRAQAANLDDVRKTAQRRFYAANRAERVRLRASLPGNHGSGSDNI